MNINMKAVLKAWSIIGKLLAAILLLSALPVLVKATEAGDVINALVYIALAGYIFRSTAWFDKRTEAK